MKKNEKNQKTKKKVEKIEFSFYVKNKNSPDTSNNTTMNSDNAIVFSASEVCGMSDEELFENFVKICTVSNLQCKHCCKKRNDINIYKQKI